MNSNNFLAALMGSCLAATQSLAQSQSVETDQKAGLGKTEIQKQESAAPATFPTQFNIKTADGKHEININTVEAPELTDWADNKLAPALADWYPKIVAMLPSEGYTAPVSFLITIKPMDGVAYTSGTNVAASSSWLKSEIGREAIGSLVHEGVHVVQQYGYNSHAPGWLVEGMADYIRWFKYEPESHGADIVWMRKRGKNFSPHYDASYRITANFLNWVTEKYDHNLVTELNAAMRDGNYDTDIWKKLTGKTVQELGAEWKKGIEDQLKN